MKNKPTQTSDVLEYLKTHDEISSWEAIQNFGATRLSAIIYRLRAKGYVINTEIRDIHTRYGLRRGVAFYHLVGCPENVQK